MYWIEWIENEEKKSYCGLNGLLYWKTGIKSGLGMLNGSGFKKG